MLINDVQLPYAICQGSSRRNADQGTGKPLTGPSGTAPLRNRLRLDNLSGRFTNGLLAFLDGCNRPSSDHSGRNNRSRDGNRNCRSGRSGNSGGLDDFSTQLLRQFVQRRQQIILAGTLLKYTGNANAGRILCHRLEAEHFTKHNITAVNHNICSCGTVHSADVIAVQAGREQRLESTFQFILVLLPGNGKFRDIRLDLPGKGIGAQNEKREQG